MKYLIILAIFAGGLLLLAYLPLLLGWVLDPLNMRKVRGECEKAGCTVVEIKPFPNHYGVTVQKNGQEYRTKCRVVLGKIKWKGKAPQDF